MRADSAPLSSRSVPEECPPEVMDIMQQCFHMDPGQRPTASQLVELLSAAPAPTQLAATRAHSLGAAPSMAPSQSLPPTPAALASHPSIATSGRAGSAALASPFEAAAYAALPPSRTTSMESGGSAMRVMRAVSIGAVEYIASRPLEGALSDEQRSLSGGAPPPLQPSRTLSGRAASLGRSGSGPASMARMPSLDEMRTQPQQQQWRQQQRGSAAHVN